MDLDIFDQDFVYLNAERVSPKVTYAIPPTTVPLAGKLGKSGEFTSYFLTKAEAEIAKIDNWSLDSGICRNLNYFMFEVDGFDKEQELLESEGRIDTVVNEVLGWIIPGASFVVSENTSSDNVSLHFVRDSLSTKTKVRPTHIGFGLTYILPIITAGLLLQGKGVLIVENPEAHLHLRISGSSGHSFRCEPASHFGIVRPPISV